MKKNNVGNIIYFIALFLLVASNLLCNVTFLTNYLFSFKILSYILFLFVGFISFFKKKTIKTSTFLLIIISLTLGIESYYIIKNSILLDLACVIIGSFDMKFDDVLKYDLLIKVLITVVILLAYFNGLTFSRFTVTRSNEYLRNSFGFFHPNTFGMYLMMMYFEYIVLKKKMNFKMFSLGIILIIIIYYTCNSRTAYYSIALFLILCLIGFFIKKLFKIKSTNLYNFRINKFLFLILLLLSVFVTKMYSLNQSVVSEIDTFLSGRLYLQYINMQQFPITFFGNDITLIGTLDNGFIKILLNYGLLTSAVYFLIYYLIFTNMKKVKNEYLALVIILILFYTLSESILLYICYNIFLLSFINYRGDLDD